MPADGVARGSRGRAGLPFGLMTSRTRHSSSTAPLSRPALASCSCPHRRRRRLAAALAAIAEFAAIEAARRPLNGGVQQQQWQRPHPPHRRAPPAP